MLEVLFIFFRLLRWWLRRWLRRERGYFTTPPTAARHLASLTGAVSVLVSPLATQMRTSAGHNIAFYAAEADMLNDARPDEARRGRQISSKR
jgi:hypothetical protein